MDNVLTFTVADVLEALKKNGFTHAFGEYFRFNSEGKIDGACALGQVGLNLKADPESIATALNYIDKTSNGEGIGTRLINFNDREIEHVCNNEGECKSVHHTYEEVVKYGEELLAPYLDHELKVTPLDSYTLVQAGIITDEEYNNEAE